MFCPSCGKEISDMARQCPSCAHPIRSVHDVSPKNKVTAALLCGFLGILGAHRFYVEKSGTGFAQLLTFGGFGIWALIDFVVILSGKFTDSHGRVLE